TKVSGYKQSGQLLNLGSTISITEILLEKNCMLTLTPNNNPEQQPLTTTPYNSADSPLPEQTGIEACFVCPCGVPSKRVTSRG
ncbi:MAG: hypothetical protein ACPG5T_05035, partial [Endozoicomonas sp.]